MSPNTRQRKCRIVQSIMKAVHDSTVDSMSVDDRVEIMTSVLHKLGLKDEFKKPTRSTKAGRKLTDLETRQKVLHFWHANSTQSTLSSTPAKLQLNSKPKIQTGLNFKESLIQNNKRGTPFYISTWQTTEKTYVELHVLYNLTQPNHTVSYGTFYSLKPFYIRVVTKSNIEMCCCKKHLHAR